MTTKCFFDVEIGVNLLVELQWASLEMLFPIQIPNIMMLLPTNIAAPHDRIVFKLENHLQERKGMVTKDAPSTVLLKIS